ncbi:5-(carboxyamino)imidazole ribonucleotide synthase [Rubricoccus marinus]|uniref:N5-carboxyaminoimidazole ribonucleotide synthase n=1 Tax=Rubricoccus marinus TaxID=716817 RepID=A0A259TXQ5_9BACT|nr:5-(carboxyamino)imidazole ribonucleotide synthase [Rubricoccus marinus]OZC02476.1 5-(carboxyamino)imidazole ribonucleotide synthase [Rubricoccus marinus]
MTLGILGGGQLGRMSALAAIRMGIDVRFLTPPASGGGTPGPVAPFANVTLADWTDPAVLKAWASGCDAITVESEWAPAQECADAAPDVPVRPHPKTLRLIRHKGRQNDALRDAGLPLPRYANCATPEAAHEAARAFGLPVVAKKYEGSYDGYGNATCRTPEELEQAWADLASGDGMLVEAFVPFEGEVSALVARREGGETAVYPIIASEHREHQLWAAHVPAGLAPEAEARAREVAGDAIAAVGGVGLLAVEMFWMRDGSVLVNEIAPRPHNTGHLTIEACGGSQFENHVRAALDLPLADPSLRVPAACMVNVVGTREGPLAPDYAAALAVSDAAVHLYGKADSRPRRKLGHVTATGETPEAAREVAERAVAALGL